MLRPLSQTSIDGKTASVVETMGGKLTTYRNTPKS
jgi:glycerol-3-phosphate dehydrogenase